MTINISQTCLNVGEKCVGCKAFSPDEKAKLTTSFKSPGYCTDSLGPDGLIEGNDSPQTNNSKIINAAGIQTCFKP